MKRIVALSLRIGLLASTWIMSGAVIDSARAVGDRMSLEAYPYPNEAVIQIQTAFRARQLAGTVTDSAGSLVPGVLVERVAPGWKERLDSTYTDGEGRFIFPNVVKGKHYLRLSKAGFCGLRVKVIVTNKAKEELRLKMHVS